VNLARARGLHRIDGESESGGEEIATKEPIAIDDEGRCSDLDGIISDTRLRFAISNERGSY